MHERLECREFTPRESSATKLGLHCGECAALLCNKVDSKVSLAQRKTLAQLIRELIETPHIGVAKLIELCNADPLRKVQLSVWAKARSLATMQLISELTADIKRDAQKVIGFVAFLSSI